MSATSQFQFGPFRLDLAEARLWRGSQAIALTPKAFAVLQYLVAHPGQLVTKEALLDAVWADTAVSDSVVKVAIGDIRKALGETGKSPRFIATAYRRGYRFMAPVIARNEPTVGGSWAAARSSLLVEREAAFACLEKWLAQARRGVRQVGFIIGEPGTGKTAVVEAFMAQTAMEPDALVLYGQCIPRYGAGEAYMPVLEALGRHCRVPASAPLREVLRQRAPLWLAQMPWLLSDAECDSLQRELQGVSAQRMLREMAEVVEVLSAEKLLVLVLEDLHWSDYASLDLIALLAQRREPAHFLLLGTYRPMDVMVYGHPLHTVQQTLQIHRRCEELALERLSEAAVAAYLQARFPAHIFPAALTQMIYHHTDGNPLFMVTMVDDLEARGLFRTQAGQWSLSLDLNTLGVGIPATLQHMIVYQLERYRQEDTRLLEAASVVGVQFAAASVAAVLDVAVERIEEQCEELVRQHMLQAIGNETWPDGTVSGQYAFRHWLYQQVAYQRVGEARQVMLHQRLGTRLEAAYGPHVAEIAAELAFHFECSRDANRAVRYLHQAAENAKRRHAYREASEHLFKGLGMLQMLAETPERARLELDMQCALGLSLMVVKGYTAPDVEQAYARARDICQQMGETPQLFPVLFGLGAFYLVRGDCQTAYGLCEQLLRIAQHQHDPELLLEAYTGLGVSLYQRGDLRAALTNLQRGLALYDPQRHRAHAHVYGQDPGVLCLSVAATALWSLGDADQAWERHHAALRLAQELAHPFSLALAQQWAAVLCHHRREPHAVQRHAAAAMALATEFEFPQWLVVGMAYHGWALAMQGQVAEGLAQMQQGLGRYQALGGGAGLIQGLALLAEVYSQDGQVQKGLTTLEEALTVVSTTGQRVYEAEIYRLQGELLLQAGQRESEAEASFLQALTLTQQQQAKTRQLQVALSLARRWRRQGEAVKARQVLVEACEGLSQGLDTADLREAKTMLATLTSVM